MKTAYFYGGAALAGVAVAAWIGFGPAPDVAAPNPVGDAAQSDAIPAEMVQVNLPVIWEATMPSARAPSLRNVQHVTGHPLEGSRGLALR